jgi:hypothetical protein
MIVREEFLPTLPYKMQSKDNGIFYYILLQEKDTRRRYLKLGTSERGTARFNDKDYKKYSFKKILYIAEFDNKKNIYDMEDLNKSILRNTKGLKWHKNDRFTYFLLPPVLPVAVAFGEVRQLRIKKDS